MGNELVKTIRTGVGDILLGEIKEEHPRPGLV
jgi:hypothetical protein